MRVPPYHAPPGAEPNEDKCARASGKAVLHLETGPYQREAIGLYRSSGFQNCGAFGAYAKMPARNIELSLFFEKAL